MRERLCEGGFADCCRDCALNAMRYADTSNAVVVNMHAPTQNGGCLNWLADKPGHELPVLTDEENK